MSNSRAFDRYHFVSNVTEQGHSFNQAKPLVSHTSYREKCSECVQIAHQLFAFTDEMLHCWCFCFVSFVYAFVLDTFFCSFPIYCITSIKKKRKEKHIWKLWYMHIIKLNLLYAYAKKWKFSCDNRAVKQNMCENLKKKKKNWQHTSNQQYCCSGYYQNALIDLNKNLDFTEHTRFLTITQKHLAISIRIVLPPQNHHSDCWESWFHSWIYIMVHCIRCHLICTIELHSAWRWSNVRLRAIGRTRFVTILSKVLEMSPKLHVSTSWIPNRLVIPMALSVSVKHKSIMEHCSHQNWLLLNVWPTE